jgi:hypothetical protein
MKALVALLLATLACAERPSPRTRDSARATAPQAAPIAVQDTTPPVVDSILVAIDGPTLIAFYPAVTQAQVDSSEELATVFDDFSYHLSSATDSLRALGLTVKERPLGEIRVVEAGRQWQFVPAKDSADFGYLLLAPGRAHRVYYSVMSNSDLVETAHEFLENRP